MASLNKRPGYEAQLPRTPHDISQKLNFTSSVGHILPVYHQLMNPSERIDFDVNMFSRINYLNTATMGEIDQNIDVFFVPMTKLWTPFESWFYGTDDYISGVFDPNGATGNTQPLDLSQSEYLPLYDIRACLSQEFPDQAALSSKGYLAKRMFRLADMLGYNPNSVFAHVVQTSQGGYGDGATMVASTRVDYPNVFPYAALAYQCIYYQHYRNEEYEPNHVGIYNADGLTARRSTPYSRSSIFELHHIDRFKDYFTRVKVSPIASIVSTAFANNNGSAYNYLQQVNNYLDSSEIINNSNSPDGDSQSPSRLDINLQNKVTQFYNDSSSVNTTGGLRSLFAVEKLMRIFGRAEKNYDSQILAHFGWKVPHDVKHQITYLGSFHNNLQINQVTATSDTETAALGSMTGTAFGQMNGKKISFTAPVHGVFMAVYYSRPKTPYIYTNDKSNWLTRRLDFWQPEFDHLGMQPLYPREVSFSFDVTQAQNNIPIGWQYRCEQYKSKYDRATVAFADPHHSVPGVDTKYFTNAFQSWVIARSPFSIMDEDGDFRTLNFNDFKYEHHHLHP